MKFVLLTLLGAAVFGHQPDMFLQNEVALAAADKLYQHPFKLNTGIDIKNTTSGSSTVTKESAKEGTAQLNLSEKTKIKEVVVGFLFEYTIGSMNFFKAFIGAGYKEDHKCATQSDCFSLYSSPIES